MAAKRGKARSSKGHGKARTGNDRIYKFVAVGIAIVVVALFSVLLMPNAKPDLATSGLVNIAAPEIQNVLGNAVDYYATETNNVTTFGYQYINQSGLSAYKAVSVSEFNANVSYQSQYPSIITSTLYELSNSTSASNMVDQLVLLGREENPLFGGVTLNSSYSETSYTYMGKSVSIYSTYSVEVLNASYIPADSVYPIYQDTSIFSYGRYTGVVTVNGYSDLSRNVSASLSELLFRDVVSGGS